jgi:hypothetical protein
MGRRSKGELEGFNTTYRSYIRTGVEKREDIEGVREEELEGKAAELGHER